MKGGFLAEHTQRIVVGDRVVACGVHRGEVVLAAKSGNWVLLRVDAGEPTRSGYLLCTPREVEQMNGWWARRLRRAADTRVSRRAWGRRASQPATERKAA